MMVSPIKNHYAITVIRFWFVSYFVMLFNIMTDIHYVLTKISIISGSFLGKTCQSATQRNTSLSLNHRTSPLLS